MTWLGRPEIGFLLPGRTVMVGWSLGRHIQVLARETSPDTVDVANLS